MYWTKLLFTFGHCSTVAIQIEIIFSYLYNINHPLDIKPKSFNPVIPNALFLYPLKKSENLIIFLDFERVEIRVHWERMG